MKVTEARLVCVSPLSGVDGQTPRGPVASAGRRRRRRRRRSQRPRRAGTDRDRTPRLARRRRRRGRRPTSGVTRTRECRGGPGRGASPDRLPRLRGGVAQRGHLPAPDPPRRHPSPPERGSVCMCTEGLHVPNPKRINKFSAAGVGKQAASRLRRLKALKRADSAEAES